MVGEPRQNGIKSKDKWNEMQKVNNGIKKRKIFEGEKAYKKKK